MIIFDTETTCLAKPLAARLSDQPQIIEFAAIKLDDVTLNEVGRISLLINPCKELDPVITKITGITDSNLKVQKSFPHHIAAISDFFLGERYSLAHNHAFDSSMLEFELKRLDMLTKFPWPPKQICTVEASFPIKNFRLNLTKLHGHLFGKDFPVAHRAMADVEALTRCVVELIKRGLIKL
jgi:DNA polymerase-3 subunit alpha